VGREEVGGYRYDKSEEGREMKEEAEAS